MSTSSFALILALLSGAGQIPGVPSGEPEEAPIAAPAPVQPKGACATPRVAVITWLANLQPDSLDPTKAALCTFPPKGMAAAETQARLMKLKRVLDARGIFIRTENIANETDVIDTNTMQPRVPVTTLLPKIYVERRGNKWGVSEETIRIAPTLFADTFPLDLGRVVEQLPPWTRRPVLGISAWQVAFLLLLLLTGWIVRGVVAWFLTSQFRRVFLARMHIKWEANTLRAAALPIGTLAMSGVIGLGLPSLQFGVKTAAILTLAVRVLAATSVVMIVYRLVDVAASVFASRAAASETKLDDQLVPLVRRGSKIIIVCVGIVFVLQNLQVDVGSLIAGLGIGGLAVALAAKDTVSHIFGSVTIFLDKPFQIGDWVQTCGVEGIVEEVGFRSTRIRTFYNSVVSVPNGNFTGAVVDNYGLRKFRRYSTKITVPFSTPPDSVEAFCDGIRAVLIAHPATRKDYYEIHVGGFGESGLDIMLYFFFDVSSWTLELRARHEVILDIMRLAEELDVRVTVPTKSIQIESQVMPTAAPTPTVSSSDALSAKVSAFGPGGAMVVAPGARVGPNFYASTADPDALRAKERK